ncbi:MAG: DNA topoisomerase-1 [Myxococcota bacterium]|jgi:DNA topoisomerase-1
MNLLIVESGAKAKTIGKALGPEWEVLATGGHICELPTRDHDPKEARKAYWSHKPGELPKPKWFLTERGEKSMAKIRKTIADKHIERVYLASDPDREGERIAWHLAQELADVPTVRVTFQEVTPTAIREAIARPREVDQDLVDAALVRTFVDRLVGFRGSKMARGLIDRKAAMGRVQTPTLGFVVERELEREAHVPVTYFEVRALTEELALTARFHEKDDPERWVDEHDKYVATRTSDSELAASVHTAVDASQTVTVTDVLRRDRKDRPKAPFTTDALLQAAGSRWGWSPKSTMASASALYEGGHITYLRTDSTRMADSAVADARRVIAATWSDAHLGAGVTGKAAANVQDAHEAIRPTRLDLVTVEGVDGQAQRLYSLIRARTLASQMAPAERASLSVTALAAGTSVPLVGSIGWYTFLGWRAAFAAVDKPYDDVAVAMAVGTELSLSPPVEDMPNPELREGETQPPPRFRQHTLVRSMKEAGIGRPSTYASTMEKLLSHQFLVEESGALAPTLAGRALWLQVAPLYQLPDDQAVFSITYTAALELGLDDVAAGQASGVDTWDGFLEPFRAAHEGARQLKKSGGVTPKQKGLLSALAANSDDSGIDEFEGLSFEGAAQRIEALRDAGIEPAPSDRQTGYLDRLLEKVGLTVAEASAWGKLDAMEEVTTRSEASALIEVLRAHPKASAPSDKQLKWVADLATKVELSEAEACGLVDVASYAELSGGRGGTASGLIDALRQRMRSKAKPKAD